MNDIQAVIFDLGDTLIYFEAVLQDGLAEADETLFRYCIIPSGKTGSE